MTGKKIGFAITGSHCTFAAIVDPLKKLMEGGDTLIPIISASVAGTSTRFGQAEDWREAFEDICRHSVIDSIKGAEEIATNKLDVVVVAPCTGNTLAKLANAVTDTTVLMACKAHMRNNRPVIIAV
ncbi:MAG TPA: dipicolinate synthase subunit B, partial [Firmicutes bacterium]|nr:dipicolinate synthase subunit B [Bacillota bacterium]